MHEAAFDALGLRWRYQLLEVGPDELGDLVRGMKAMKFMGANFTIPHKVAIIDHLDGVAESAQLIGAVNTIGSMERRVIGENTDGKGFTGALAEKNVPVAGKNVTLLGAGGAARAISVELALAGVQNITIVNRSAKRAEPLVKVINDQTKTKATFVPWRGTYAVDAATDILVNATSIGLFPSTDKPDIDYGAIARGMVVVDVIPNPPEIPLLNEAARHGTQLLTAWLCWWRKGRSPSRCGPESPRRATSCGRLWLKVLVCASPAGGPPQFRGGGFQKAAAIFIHANICISTIL